MNGKSFFALALVCLIGGTAVCADQQPGVSPGPGVRYATDAYPGFDSEDSMLRPEKKTPRWFSFWFGPKMPTAAEQLRWADSLALEGSISRAERAYDALVREWPTAPEAPMAQLRLAELYAHEDDPISAFEEYQYLMDFFSFRCDYAKVAAVMYDTAEKMREMGKKIMFFRFANTVDVRRAYESLVLRAPGEPFIPDAMLTIAKLREDEDQYDKAVTVLENLRNLYPTVPQARTALYEEAAARMELLHEYSYNRSRIRETIDFLKTAVRGDVTVEMRDQFRAWLDEARVALDNAVYHGDQFYDSVTRTKRSAIHAYRMYLEEYPHGEHAEEARARLAELEAPEVPEVEEAEEEETVDADYATEAAPKRVPKKTYTLHEPTLEGEPEWLREYAAKRGIKLEQHEPEAGRRPDWLKGYMEKKEE